MILPVLINPTMGNEIGKAMDNEIESGIISEVIYRDLGFQKLGVPSWGSPQQRLWYFDVFLGLSSTSSSLERNHDSIVILYMPLGYPGYPSSEKPTFGFRIMG